MIIITPGKALGAIERPRLGFTLGYWRTRSTLGTAADILSVLPPSSLVSKEPDDLTSSESLSGLAGTMTFSIDGSDHTFAVVGSMVWDITSREVVGPLYSDLPDDVISALPPTTIVSEEPHA